MKPQRKHRLVFFFFFFFFRFVFFVCCFFVFFLVVFFFLFFFCCCCFLFFFSAVILFIETLTFRIKVGVDALFDVDAPFIGLASLISVSQYFVVYCKLRV